MVSLNPGLEGNWTMPPRAPPRGIDGEQGKKLWLVTIVVSQRDADYIESQNRVLNAPGLGLRHEFRRVGVLGSVETAVVEPPNGGAT